MIREELFIQSFLKSPDGMLIMEKKTGSVVAINRALAKTLGSPEGLDLSLSLQTVIRGAVGVASQRGALEQKIKNTVIEERDGFYQILSDASGNTIEYRIRPRQFNLTGRDYYLLVFSQASGKMDTELLIEEAIAEKEVLLREVHHRVKNNLQVISSLMHLQTQFVNDPKILGYMTDSQNRVRALGYVYEHLYRSKEIGMIDFSEYTARITQSLMREYSQSSQRIHIQCDVHNVTLNPDTSVPLGLLLNELISNALRHAFPGNREGNIVVSMHPHNAGYYSLVVRDDGVGIPGHIDIRKTQSLGLLLVSSLVSQLDGTIELKRDQGTEFTIQFRPLQYKERR